LVSTLVNSHNKKNFLDFDQTIDAIEAVFKETFELYKKLKIEMEQYENVIVAKKDAINNFCSNIDNINNNETIFYTISETNQTCNNTNCANTCSNNIALTKALDCAEGFNCTEEIINTFCEGIQCILRQNNYQMRILSNEELTTPKLGSLLMPLVNNVNKGTDSKKELNNLYNNDACKVLFNDDEYEYNNCAKFWSSILVKGMEQSITQMSVIINTVIDELNSLNSGNKKFSEIINPNSSFSQYELFVEYYLFKSYMKTVEIFEDFRLSKLKSTRKIFYGILYGYIIGTVILFFILLYFVYSSKYVFNSFLNFIGILPVKYLIEDELLYKDILKLEQSIF
jgi:hypothetical protein